MLSPLTFHFKTFKSISLPFKSGCCGAACEIMHETNFEPFSTLLVMFDGTQSMLLSSSILASGQSVAKLLNYYDSKSIKLTLSVHDIGLAC